MIIERGLTLAPGQTAGDVAAAFLLLLRKFYGDEDLRISLAARSARGEVTLASYHCPVPAGLTLAEHARQAEEGMRSARATQPAGSEPARFALAADAAALRQLLSPPGQGFELAACAGDTPGRVGLLSNSPEHDPAYLHRFAEGLGQVLERMSSAPMTRVADLDILTAAERAKVVREFNATARDYPRHACIPQLFAEQAARAPGRAAVEHAGATLSYGQLNDWSLRLAALLRERGVGRGDRVALLAGKVPEMVAGILAVLRTGAAYVPVDPGYPPAHAGFLLRDSGARLLLTSGPGAGDQLSPEATAGVETVCLAGAALPQAPAALEGGTLGGPASAQDTAYIMYTSGSTGRPKGVRVSHRAVVRLVKNTDFATLSADTRILQTGAVAFDAITFELWGALLNGGTIILIPGHSVLDAPALGAAIRRHAATTMWLTAPLFHRLADSDPAIFRPLRELLAGGDVLSPGHVGRVMAACPGLLIINGYGPTENTTFSAAHRIRERPLGRIPVGRPVANSTAYVLDLDRQPQPVGVPGELYVGGDGLSDGYLNRPELTEASFVGNPFGEGRLYRTGDRARWLPDGTIDFLGRADSQVKVRGFRVELGEVEEHLARAPGVREAAVLLRERADGVEKYLCGFVTCDPGVAVDAVRAALRGELPPHMVPSALVLLERMPVNANGKVDRAALAAIAPPEPAVAGPAPRDEVERALAGIWRQALELTEVHVTDNFLDAGGTSLAAAKLSAEISGALGVHVPAAAILANPTIEELARLVRSRTASAGPRITPVPSRPFYPLTFQQRGIYAEQQKDTAATPYNVPVVIDLPYRADPARLREAVRALVARHEVLRTTFVPVGDDVVALVHDHAEVPVETLAGAPGQGFVRPFDLAAGPLLRVGLHCGRAGSHIAIDVHHIAVDGITMGLLLDDLTELYSGTELAPPPLRYADYAVWQRGEDARRLREQQEPFWLEKFAEPPRAPALPADFPRAPIRDIRGSLLEFDLGAVRGMRLRECSRRLGVTPFHTLAAVYFLFLARITGEHDLTAGTPVTGRTEPELAQVAGLFTSTLCLRARISPAQRFTDFARTVSRGIVEMAQHQDYPFSQLVDRVAPQRDYARNPLFDTMIAYQDTGLMARGAMGGRARPGDSMNPHTMFDLNLQVYETGQSYSAAWGYSTALFLDQTVRLFRDNLLELMDAVLTNPERCAGELISSPITVQELHPVTEFNFGDQKERRKADGGF